MRKDRSQRQLWSHLKIVKLKLNQIAPSSIREQWYA